MRLHWRKRLHITVKMRTHGWQRHRRKRVSKLQLQQTVHKGELLRWKQQQLWARARRQQRQNSAAGNS